MTETSGNTFRGCAVLDQDCGVCVPEGVRVQSFLAKFPAQGVDRDKGTVFFCANQLFALHIEGRRQFFRQLYGAAFGIIVDANIGIAISQFVFRLLRFPGEECIAKRRTYHNGAFTRIRLWRAEKVTMFCSDVPRLTLDRNRALVEVYIVP